MINRYLGSYTPEEVPNTTRDARVTVMDTSSISPSKIQKYAEEIIDEYVGYCNEGNYAKAYNMLSEDCRTYEFDNDGFHWKNVFLLDRSETADYLGYHFLYHLQHIIRLFISHLL